jgi:tryptophan-rich sensory protein
MNTIAKNITFFLIFFLLVFITASAGSYFTSQSVSSWYQDLNKPGFTPPSWVFGPVWTLLYIMIALAGFDIYRRAGLSFKVLAAYLVYFSQLFFNFFWSLAFFGMRSPGIGLAVILLLIVLIASGVVLFYRHSKVASLLFVPYLLWVLFAAALNFAIYRLN